MMVNIFYLMNVYKKFEIIIKLNKLKFKIKIIFLEIK